MSKNPIDQALSTCGVVVLDGALATVLETRGCDLVDRLWSAKVLLENPELIYQLHYDYYVAGAKCVSTATYQASPKSYQENRGIDMDTSISLIKLSVSLAQRARDDFLAKHPNNGKSLLIAGSVGPYGAYLANGSEYRGDYTLPESEFIDFHRPRIQALIEAGVDILALETIPRFDEAKALVKLLADYPNTFAWFSFTLSDAQHISDGTLLSDVATYLNGYSQVAAIGINCVRLEFVTDALKALHQSTQKPLIVYPNSGEHYDADTKTWNSLPSDLKIIDQLDDWQKAGARLIGGCCRTTPDDITAISNYFQSKSA